MKAIWGQSPHLFKQVENIFTTREPPQTEASKNNETQIHSPETFKIVNSFADEIDVFSTTL